jgi:hypothetical protein
VKQNNLHSPGRIDIIDKVLDTCYHYFPDAIFIQSLMHQYEERGSLSKKQLQGLYLKAQKVQDMPPAWLATIEAIIKKMPTRYKSVLPENKPVYQKDEATGKIIETILYKAPQHKQVLFLKNKFDNNEPLTTVELAELEKFRKVFEKKP